MIEKNSKVSSKHFYSVISNLKESFLLKNYLSEYEKNNIIMNNYKKIMKIGLCLFMNNGVEHKEKGLYNVKSEMFINSLLIKSIK